MPEYKYKAIDEKGRMRSDTMVAGNIMELEKRLGIMGFDLVNHKEQAARGALIRLKSNADSRRELISFTFHMQQMTNAGVPILDSLKDICDAMAYRHFKDVISIIIDDINGGKTFSQALAKHPQLFDSIYVNLVRIGEETGLIDRVLFDIAENLKWHDELISHTRKIMIYPLIVLTVVMGVVTFLMVYLMPQMAPFIVNMGGEIPVHTRALISVSTIFINYWYFILLTPVFVYMLIKYMMKISLSFHFRVDRIKLGLPIFGELMLKVRLARFSSYFALMYSSGITVLDSLAISKDLVDNLVLAEGIENAKTYISEGTGVSKSFEKCGVFPSMVIHMFKVGEDTGAMDDALLSVSYFYNREVRETIEKIEPAIVPIMTIFLGSIIMWIMLSVLGPVYDTISTIKF